MSKKRLECFFVALLLVLQLMGTVFVQAAPVPAQQEIRVGLTSMYSGKEALTIYNIKLGYGYCVNQTYLQEAEFTSHSGFTFVPINGYFIAEDRTYGSYQAAKQAAEGYQDAGVDAYPGSTYQCSWRVYFGNASKYSEAENMKAHLREVTGKNSFEILSGSNYRIKLTGTFGTVLIDVDEHYA